MTLMKDSEDWYDQRNAAHFNKLLDHYEWIAKLDKAYAWKRVNELAESTKYTHCQYESLPALLTERMRQLQASSGQKTGGSTHD